MDENEHGYVGFVAQAVDSNTSSVATGGSPGACWDLQVLRKYSKRFPTSWRARSLNIGGPMEQFEYVLDSESAVWGEVRRVLCPLLPLGPFIG